MATQQLRNKAPNRQQRQRNRQRGGGGGGGIAALGSTQPLKPRQLLKAAKALTRLTVRPQVRAARSLINEFQGEQQTQAQGLEHLGQHLASNVGATYNNLAVSGSQNQGRQMALAQMLNQNMQQANNNATVDAQNTAQGQLGGMQEAMQLRGAPGGGAAQQALANMVAAQSARQSQVNQASANVAASQGAGFAQLAGSMNQASQMRGAEAQTNIAQNIASRVAESNQKYGQQIRQSEGDLRDAKNLKGSTLLSNIMQLRKSEQDFRLGRAATAQKGQAAALSAATTRRGQNMTAASNAASRATTRRGQNISAKTSRGNSKRAQQGKGSATGNGLAAAHQGIAIDGVPSNPKEWAQLEAYVKTKGGVSAAKAAQIVNHLKKKHGVSGGAATAGGGKHHPTG